MQEVYDHLRQKAPEAPITIVGRQAEPALRPTIGDKPGIHLQGPSAGIQPFLFWKGPGHDGAVEIAAVAAEDSGGDGGGTAR